ncbi:hypothetical protein CHRYSEO8AT_140041 [Chryseobacterium sp. 8AT]|nr:hypothetical protein CHRYSEO8AT_140041 [Chryseobacterium sp. 8AT]
MSINSSNFAKQIYLPLPSKNVKFKYKSLRQKPFKFNDFKTLSIIFQFPN